ncbi:MAG: HAD family hydrolase [Suipraeoptans sp.]
MKIEGAIFDMDGTILDSMVGWNTLAERYLLSIGIEPRHNLNEVFKDLSLEKAAVYYQEHYNVDKTIAEIVNGINLLIKDFYYYDALLKPGAEEFLKFLFDNNVKMCIATASAKGLAHAALKRCGVREYFEEILSCQEIGRGKDVPFIYQAALQNLGTRKENTIVFEDALYAIKTAKNAGFIVAGVYDKYEQSTQEVMDISNYYINDFRKARELFK